MTRPDNIPQDVWDAALGTYSEKLPPSPVALIGFEAIALAILAERERCAVRCDERADRHKKSRHQYEDEASQTSCLSDALEAMTCAATIRKGDEH